jgi:uncharacterized protein (TIGR00645 family)
MLSLIDKAMLASRYILLAFFGGLMVALAVYGISFLGKLWKFATGIGTMSDSVALVSLLILLDSALVASLVVMVALSSYDSLVSQLATDAEDRKTNWVAVTDPGNLKIKLASALTAISSIHLLQMFMDLEKFEDRQITWALVIHGAFLAGAVCLALVDKLTKGGKGE